MSVPNDRELVENIRVEGRELTMYYRVAYGVGPCTYCRSEGTIQGIEVQEITESGGVVVDLDGVFGQRAVEKFREVRHHEVPLCAACRDDFEQGETL